MFSVSDEEIDEIMTAAMIIKKKEEEERERQYKEELIELSRTINARMKNLKVDEPSTDEERQQLFETIGEISMMTPPISIPSTGDMPFSFPSQMSPKDEGPSSLGSLSPRSSLYGSPQPPASPSNTPSPEENIRDSANPEPADILKFWPTKVLYPCNTSRVNYLTVLPPNMKCNKLPRYKGFLGQEKRDFASTLQKIGDFFSRNSSTSQSMPNSPQRKLISSQSVPNSPQRKLISSQSMPSSPQKKPNSPQSMPNSPLKKPNSPFKGTSIKSPKSPEKIKNEDLYSKKDVRDYITERSTTKTIPFLTYADILLARASAFYDEKNYKLCLQDLKECEAYIVTDVSFMFISNHILNG